MATITGTVEQLLAAETFAKVQITDVATGELETFLLYSDTDAAVPDRVTQGLWLALCRDALLNGNQLTVLTPTNNSGVVSTVVLPKAVQP